MSLRATVVPSRAVARSADVVGPGPGSAASGADALEDPLRRSAALDIAPRAACRRATLLDLEALLAIERACFDGDRISRRSFRRFLVTGDRDLILREQAGVAVGFALVLYRRGAAVSRLYSFAVAPEHRRRGHAQALLDAAQAAARARGMATLRLEVRSDNPAAQALYTAAGFVRFGHHRDYYEDHCDALRFQKALIDPEPDAHRPVRDLRRRTRAQGA